MINRIRRALHSIHVRLLLVITASGLGILILILVAQSARRVIATDAFRNSVGQYVRYLVNDMGNPPDFDRAVEIARNNGMIIHYLPPRGGWSTSGQALSPYVAQNPDWPATGSVRTGKYRGHTYFTYQADSEHRFVFEMVGGPPEDRRLAWLDLSLVFCLALLLTGAFFWGRRIMAPLHPLSQGVRLVGAGHLDHRVHIHCNDELGELASAFNWMAEQLQHLIRSKDQMLLDVSHELRSPLTRMRVALEMAPDGPLKESLDEDIREMDRMVMTILANARMQSGNLDLHRQMIDMVPLIREAIQPMKDEPPGVLVSDAPESLEAFLDHEKVKIVIRNVVGNAIKYSHAASRPISILLRPETDSDIIEIRDEGVGIPVQDLAFVFEPFYRVDRSRSRETGGFGLGLSLCKAIMEAHGGSISIQSTPGEGTIVRLEFPRG